MDTTRNLWVGLAATIVASFIVLASMRVPGDTLLSAGAMLLAWCSFRLWVSPAREALVIGELEESRS